MSTTPLSDLINLIQNTQKEAYDKAYKGETPTSQWDANLPIDIEYRAVIDKAVYGQSKSSGRDQFTITWEIQEPSEYAGKKFQEYVSPNPTNEAGARQLAELFGALQVDLTGFGENMDAFTAQFEGRSACIVLRRWGQENDRIGIRWITLDRGQELRTGIAPQKPRRGTADLRPEINIPKDDGPFPETVTPPPAAAPAPAPQQQTVTPPLPGGVNLPPGLS